MRRLLLCLSCCALAAPAFAFGDYYAAPTGVDAPLGGSQAAPWKTVTYALSQLSTEGHTIHVAAGTYSPASGETFPLLMEPRISIQGAGVEETVFDPGLTTTGFAYLAGYDPFSGKTTKFEPDTRLSDLTILRPQIGVQLSTGITYGAECSPTLSSVWILSPQTGISVSAVTGPCRSSIRDFRVHGASDTGLWVYADVTQGQSVTLDGGEFKDCARGYLFDSGGSFPTGLATTQVSRVRFAGCGIGAVGSTGKGSVFLAFDACLFQANTTAVLLDGFLWGASADLERCTVYANSTGLSNNGVGNNHYRVRSSIVWGNTTADLVWNGVFPFEQSYDIEWSNIGAGFPLTPSNLSVPPGFVSPLDAHLAPASALVDRGDPAAVLDGIDSDGDPLRLDGDGDAFARVDIGFDEYNRVHLDGPAAIAPGALVTLQATGPAGWPFAIGVSTAPADLPIPPFGSLLLDPAALVLFAGGVLPATPQIQAPPALPSGLWIGFQFGALDPALLGVGSTSNRLQARVP